MDSLLKYPVPKNCALKFDIGQFTNRQLMFMSFYRSIRISMLIADVLASREHVC